MIVAQLRDATFYDDDGTMKPRNCEISFEALKDVAEWLGFQFTDDYLRNLTKEREKIFLRAHPTTEKHGEGD